MKRGIIVSTPIIARRGEFQVTSGGLDPQELRYWTLFFDKLNFPEFKGFYIDPGDDARFLHSAGIFERHKISDFRIRMSGDPSQDRADEQYQHYVLQAFRELDAQEPGSWAVATGEGSLRLDADHSLDGRGVLFTLHRALPVPNEDVPLAEVLEFKEKRKSELIALRLHLDDVYQHIASSPDAPHALNSHLLALDRSTADYVKAIRSSRIKRCRETSLGGEFRLRQGVNAGVAAYSQGLPLTSSLLVGAVATLDIRATAGLKDFHRNVALPWRYIARYHDDLFRQ